MGLHEHCVRICDKSLSALASDKEATTKAQPESRCNEQSMHGGVMHVIGVLICPRLWLGASALTQILGNGALFAKVSQLTAAQTTCEHYPKPTERPYA